ncbi:unnamed protein product [[Candida] boidinii]|uniref:Unnamed protein product n=1 Tax=Candida boidinii TaxID=5477 RepID=A0A9W6SYG7_CANBO|nr:hypothetical protein B5S30_g3839 [[Candida] boidinii]OWB85779.1 hypothetical protein B5S33_g4451 [[Candida] boidinii]GME68700.1 unnamed protein product [[Candida] boidinii]
MKSSVISNSILSLSSKSIIKNQNKNYLNSNFNSYVKYSSCSYSNINRNLIFKNQLISRRFNSTKVDPPKKDESTPLAPATTTTTPPAEKKLTILEKIKHEAKHYWDGTKLLGLEIKISSKLLVKIATGYELTRREYRQLQRTISDVLRLFPFAMFVIIPFAELLLPIALKLFPNLLPSTYESKLDKEKKLNILRNSRLKVSEVIRSSKSLLKLPSNITEEQRQDFKDFYNKIKSSDQKSIDRNQLFRVAKLFKDDLILDNISRPVLIAIARYINLKPFGTDQILRYRIRHKMLKIKSDDKLIDYEGVDSLTVPELQIACASRGIRVHTATPDQMRRWLQYWLDLTLREKVPSTLCIMVNAYFYGDVYTSQYDALKAVLCSLPEEFYHVQELHVDDEKATFEQRMKVVKEQEQLIKSENIQEKDHVIIVKDKLSLDEPAEPAEPAEPEGKTPAEKTESKDSTNTTVKKD